MLKVIYRSCEITSRVLLLAFSWLIYGPLALCLIVFFDCLFALYNHLPSKQRVHYDEENHIKSLGP